MEKIIFDFAGLKKSDQAVKNIKKAFKRAGANVVTVDIDARIKKTAGFPTRSVHLGFSDNQTVALSLKESGDVFQVKINRTIKPLKEQDDHFAAIQEIVSALDASRAAHQKRLAKQKVEVPAGMRASRKRKAVVLREKVDALQESIADAEAKLTDMGVKFD